MQIRLTKFKEFINNCPTTKHAQFWKKLFYIIDLKQSNVEIKWCRLFYNKYDVTNLEL